MLRGTPEKGRVVHAEKIARTMYTVVSSASLTATNDSVVAELFSCTFFIKTDEALLYYYDTLRGLWRDREITDDPTARQKQSDTPL